MSPFFWTDHWSSVCLSSTITPWGSLLARNLAACGWAGSPLTTISMTWTSTSPRSGQWQWPWGMNKATSTAGAREGWDCGRRDISAGHLAQKLTSYFSSSLPVYFLPMASALLFFFFFSSSSPFPIYSFLFTPPFSSCSLCLPHLLPLFSPLCSPSFSSF